MKLYKYLSFFMLTSFMLLSCGEDESMTKKLENGINVFTFTETIKGFSAIADGEEYVIDLKAKVTGPNMQNVSGPVTAKMMVDTQASTAIEGTHYRIDNPNLTLNGDMDYLGAAKIVMLTEGIQTPLAASPKIVMRFVDASGSDAVVASGKELVLTLNYACPSALAGEYAVRTTSSTGADISWSETITNTGVGTYLTQRVGTWNPPLNPVYGFVFTDVCDVITVPKQGLADIYSNAVYGSSAGSVDPLTGVITIKYTIEFAAGNRDYVAVYTPK